MEIKLYNNSSDSRRLNKTLSLILTTNFRDKGPIDYLYPTIILGHEGLGTIPKHSELSTVNYCYIPAFHRYYFVRVTSNQSGIYTLNCSVDPLMSYREYISKMTCFIARQESVYNKYIIDEKFPMRATRYLEYKDLGPIPTGSGANIAVTVTGGV